MNHCELWSGSWSAELPTETGIYWFTKELLKPTNLVMVTVEEVDQEIGRKKVPMILGWNTIMGPNIDDLEGYWAQIQPPDSVYVRSISDDGVPNSNGFFEGISDFVEQESCGYGHGLSASFPVAPCNKWL